MTRCPETLAYLRQMEAYWAEAERLPELRADSATIPAESPSVSLDPKRTDDGHR